jgi:predicted phage terminase large subunit-like protein
MTILNERILEGFVSSVLAKRFDKPAPIPNCHREWWKLCTGPDRFVAIAAPRGHAKSTAITHSYALACMLFRQRDFVLIVSDTETQAVLFLQDIKKELMDNEDLVELFGLKKNAKGLVQFVKETESDVIVEFEDGHQFRVMAKGSEQKVRGLKWGSKRPDLIICDDLENDEIVMNPERREKFRRWFYGALLPCRSKDGIIRIVGTILHLDSLLERLMPQEHDKATVVELLKTWTGRRSEWRSVKYRAHDKEWSIFLWPEMHDKEALWKEYQTRLEQGLPDIYFQEFLNEPIDESNALFKKSDFIPLKDEERDVALNYYIAGDLAITEKNRADYTAFVVGGVDKDGFLQIRHVIRSRMDSKEIVDTIFALEKVYKPVVFSLEDGAIAKSLGPFLYDEMPRRNVFPNLVLIVPSKDKIQRAQSIRARMRAGAVKFDKKEDWYPQFEQELLRFPRDRHDDQVDAIAYLGHILDKMTEAPSPEEMAESQYKEEYEQSGLYERGRSVTTGY